MSKEINLKEDFISFVQSKESGILDDKGNLTNFGVLLISMVCISLALAIIHLRFFKGK